MRESPEYVQDAREGARVGNSVVGSLLSIQFKTPRQATEEAVIEALGLLDAEQKAAAQAPSDDADEFTLPRTGDRPLKFTGEKIAYADGERLAGKEQNRWHEIAVYRIQTGRYVVHIAYRTRWQGELDFDMADIDGSSKGEGVATILRNYDPTQWVRGYPEGAGYADKQARLLSDIRQRYQALVSEVLKSDEFAEEVA